MMANSSACRKSLFDTLSATFLNKERSKKSLIGRERHPSWVSFTLSSFPSSEQKRLFRQSQEFAMMANSLILFT